MNLRFLGANSLAPPLNNILNAPDSSLGFRSRKLAWTGELKSVPMLIRGRGRPDILTIDVDACRLADLKALQRHRDQIFGRRRRVRAAITGTRVGNRSVFGSSMVVFFDVVAVVAVERDL